MKNPLDYTPEQLREVAFNAILKEVGPLGLARFIMENGLGSGDYTRDRHQWLPTDKTARQIAKEWQELRKGAPDA